MIIESVIAKATALGLGKSAKSAACLVGKKALEKAAKEATDRAFHSVIPPWPTNFSLIEQALFALDLSTEEGDDLEHFLTSTTFENFIRGTGLLAVTESTALPDQRAALEMFLTRILPSKGGAAIAALAAALSDFIVDAAPDAWKTAVGIGLLPASWQTDSTIQALVADQVANSRHHLEHQIAAAAAPFQEIDVFVSRYKRALRYATSKLRPQSVNESPSIPVEQLYVEPMVIALGVTSSRPSHRNLLLTASRRSVLLGNPGGGKSTLAGKLCFDVCADLVDDEGLDVPELAAHITLRDYAQHQKTSPCSVVEYLEIQSKSEFQIDPPPGAFKLLLLSGRILIVFDGLDELVETRDRLAVRSAVEHFTFEYPVAAILVTSREVGYEQAPLDRGQFGHYKLSPFDNKQVVDYATKWFKYSCGPQVNEGVSLAASFVSESAIVPDIRSNPLMLGLLCNLYRQDGFIPRNRPEIYQRCADLLFTKWDRSRGIKIQIPLDHRLKPAMSRLAHWIYSDEALQMGVTEEHLVRATSDYLREWVEDDAQATQVSQEFVDFFSGRAWVFTDVGSDKTQRLYQFTHRTFLEYFTADELVRLHPNPVDLHKDLLEHIKARNWDVVCQLAYQLAVQRTPSDDLLIKLLCEAARLAPLKEKLAMLSFLARTMDVLYPKPATRRSTVRFCIETVFENIHVIESGGDDDRTPALEILGGVLEAPEEVQKINASEISVVIQEIVNSTRVAESIRSNALLLSSSLAIIYHVQSHQPEWGSTYDFWVEQDEILATALSGSRLTLAEADSRIAIQSWWRREIGIGELFARFGPSVCFDSRPIPLGNWYRTSIASAILRSCLVINTKQRERDSDAEQYDSWIVVQAKECGGLILRSAIWRQELHDSDFPGGMSFLYSAGEGVELGWPADTDVCESLLVCTAVLNETRFIERLPFEELSGTASDVLAMALSRHNSSHRLRAHQIVDERCVSSLAKDRLHGWIEGTEAFTTNEPTEKPLVEQGVDEGFGVEGDEVC